MIAALTDTEGEADLVDWVTEFSITHPVGGDTYDLVFDAYRTNDAQPQYAVIDQDFVLVHVGGDREGCEALAASLL